MDQPRRTPKGRRDLTDALEDRDLNAVARNRPTTDHPVWTEPYPRRVRAFLDGVAMVDSTRAPLLLEAEVDAMVAQFQNSGAELSVRRSRAGRRC
jgi:hypothetical protein